MKNLSKMAAALVTCLIALPAANAQTQLPQPAPAVKGKVAETYDKSTPS